jgi:hypothetical protein
MVESAKDKASIRKTAANAKWAVETKEEVFGSCGAECGEMGMSSR